MVEDDATIADFVSKGLAESGYAVDVATDGERGSSWRLKGGYDAAIVDVMLPRLDGLTLIDRMRARGVGTPVLILSAQPNRRRPGQRASGGRRRLPDQAVRVRGAAGACPGPHPAIHRSTEPTRLSLGDLSLDLLTRRAERAGTPIDLRPREFSVARVSAA